MILKRILAGCGLIWLLAGALPAAGDAMVLNDLRLLTGEATYFSTLDGGGSDPDFDQAPFLQSWTGMVSAVAQDPGSTGASAFPEMETTLTQTDAFRFSQVGGGGSSTVGAGIGSPGASASAIGASTVQLTFQIDVPHFYSFTGSISRTLSANTNPNDQQAYAFLDHLGSGRIQDFNGNASWTEAGILPAGTYDLHIGNNLNVARNSAVDPNAPFTRTASGTWEFDFSLTPVPEPRALLLVLLGAAVLRSLRRRQP